MHPCNLPAPGLCPALCMPQAATLRADRRRRRWVAPIRPKPAIIIAQLAGSGTGSEIENESAVPFLTAFDKAAYDKAVIARRVPARVAARVPWLAVAG